MRGFVAGATMGARIGVALACVGLIYVSITATGLGIRLGGLVEVLSGGYLFPALVLTMLLSIVLGTGLVTPAAYMIAVLVVGPLLVKMGLPTMTAHFFVFYFAIISALTPPIALASLAGAGIAGGDFWRTSLNAVKLALVGFFIPFFIAYNPVLLLQPMEPLLATFTLVAIPMGLICMVVGVFNHFLTEITFRERWLYILATLSLFGYCFIHNYLLFGVGVLLFIGLMALEWRKVRTQRRLEAGLPM